MFLMYHNITSVIPLRKGPDIMNRCSPGDFYLTLLENLGRQNWWPADTMDEICIGAILTQNTAWTNVEKSLALLKNERSLSLEALAETPVETLETLIRPSGFFRRKALYLKEFASRITGEYGSLERLFELPLTRARRILLLVKGIGPETADSILCYAGRFPVLVVDAYTRRIGCRLEWFDHESGPPRYETMQDYLMERLDEDATTLGEFHALVVSLAKSFCRKNPVCSFCPLSAVCSTGSARNRGSDITATQGGKRRKAQPPETESQSACKKQGVR